MRKAGTILHISSLPSPYGIGTMGKEAYDFVDFLKASGLSFWQVLPLVPSGSGNSPYASYSMYAGNPDFIDLDRLRRQGLLALEDIQAYSWGNNPARVDFQAIHQGRKALLEKAYQNSKNPLSVVDFDLLTQVEDENEKEGILEDAELLDGLKELAALDGDEGDREKTAAEQAVYQPVVESVDYSWEVSSFRQQNQGWVEDYALYMALKEKYQQKPWYEWDSEIANREPWAVERFQEELREQIDFWVFVQYLFYSQWNALKLYANDNNVEMIGDIPIYSFHDSVDVWVSRRYFWLDRKNMPVKVAGVPPDAFSEDGQRWGNPLYRWDLLEDDGYQWWINRIRHNLQLYDWVRIDHFRGFDQFYAIDAGEPDAKKGEWCEGPGYDLFKRVKEELGDVKILAEDLGVITPSVRRLLEKTGFPGMKVLQFACSGSGNAYLPHNAEENAFMYTGTHDNDTTLGWLESGDKKEIAFARRYFGLNREEGLNWGMIRGALGSRCKAAMIPMQDFLDLGSGDRMNIPATPDGNWGFRMKPGAIANSLAEKISVLLECFGRHS